MKKYSQIIEEVAPLSEMSPTRERDVYHALVTQVATKGKHSKKKDIQLLQKLTKKVLRPSGYMGEHIIVTEEDLNEMFIDDFGDDIGLINETVDSTIETYFDEIKSDPKTSVGKNRVYVVMTAVAAPLNYINIRYFDSPYKLVSYKSNQFTFSIKGKTISYPEMNNPGRKMFLVDKPSILEQQVSSFLMKYGFKANIKSFDPTRKSVREEYKEGKLFKVGDLVETNDGRTAEVISLGTNYLTLVSEGVTFKKWLNEVTRSPKQKVKVSTKKPIGFRISDVGAGGKEYNVKTDKEWDRQKKEQIEFKGYTTSNLTEDVKALLSTILEHQDQYAVLNCLKTVDSLLGMNSSVELWFENYRVDFDRAVKYLAKFDLPISIVSEAEDKLLEYALLEGARFSAADKMKVAKIIATTFGEYNHAGDHAEVVNRAAKTFKSGRHTPEAWSIGGAMLNKATEAGIAWDKNIFHKSVHRIMGLK